MDERRRSYRLAFILFWSVLLYFCFQRYVVGVGIISERSMLPLFQEGERYLINKFCHRFVPPQRGDIIVLRRMEEMLEEEQQYIKRVVGLPGETFQILGGLVFINGHILEESYAIGPTTPDLGPLVIAPRSYFVMGDNRPESMDSRSFGVVSLQDIEGKIQPGQWFPWW